ncbi:MAG TPA: superoxide dismutase [Novosphingobium sp.]|nr:superoxide dismutase [Novosphingobium sp.]
MTIELIDLPYPEDALAPSISAETLRTHHGKHHAAYVNKTNEAAAKLGMEGASLEEIIAAARKANDEPAYDNAAQAWNHGFYWHSLAPGGPGPDAGLGAAIERDFGSLVALSDELAGRGEKHFASGWVWLAADKGGKLSVEETHDGDTLALGAKRPLLTIDLWEHAYYLDYKNERPKHLKAVIGTLLAWDFAARNYAAEETWRYPG